MPYLSVKFQSSPEKLAKTIKHDRQDEGSTSEESEDRAAIPPSTAEPPKMPVQPSGLEEPNLDELLNLGNHNDSIDTNDPIAAAVR